jgi:hypothetical protein
MSYVAFFNDDLYQQHDQGQLRMKRRKQHASSFPLFLDISHSPAPVFSPELLYSNSVTLHMF